MFVFSDHLPAVVGHRGAPRVAKENSLAAFAAAAAAGASWVELDARRTADDQLVVVHDPLLPDGRPVVEHSLADLKARGLVGLAEVFAALPAGMGIDLELKNLPGEPDHDDEQQLAALVADVLETMAHRPLIVSSFNPLALVALRERRPEVALGLLTMPLLPLASGIDLAKEFAVQGVFPHVSAADLTPARIAEAHAADLAVLVWTVDNPHDMRRLADAGVDALCTNEPEALVAVLAER